MQQQSLIDANLERAAYIAELCARRAENVGTVGAWHGYRASEGLEGILVRDDILRYARPGSDNGDQFADIFFHEPKLTDVKEVDWGKETPVEKDVIERYHSSITKIKGVEYDDKIQHTFSKIVTLMESFKIGLELAIKAYFEASYSGVKGGAEVSAKITAEYNRQWGTTETHTDTVERDLILPVDFEGDIDYEATRSIDKVQRQIKAVSNMDYRIGFVSGPTIPPENRPYYDHTWASIEEFISVGMGYASAEKSMYKPFMVMKLTQDEIDRVRELGEQSVEFMTKYDKVNNQEIRIL